MMEYIRELLGLANDELDEIRDLHAFWVPKIVVGFDLLLLFGFLLNLGGVMRVNLIFAWIAASAAVILATRPEGPAIAVSLGALSGAAQEPQTVPKQISEFLKIYARWSAGALFWVSGILLLLGTIPVEENPGAALVILAAAIVVFSYVIYKKKELSIASWAIYIYACILIIASFLSLIPSYTWIHYTGYDVKGVFTSNPTEIGVSNIEKAAERERQAKNARILRVMERKAEQSGGKPLDEVLSLEELELFVKLSKQRDARSLGKKFSRVSWPSWPSRAEAKAEPPPPPPPPVYLAAMPAPAPMPPTIVAPKPLPPPEHKVPDWKVIEEDMDGGVYHKRQLRSTVEFSADEETVTMRQQYGNWFIFKGQRIGEGRYKGTWQDEFPRDQYYYWGEFEIEFAPDLQSACGWKTIREDTHVRIKTTWEYIPRQ